MRSSYLIYVMNTRLPIYFSHHRHTTFAFLTVLMASRWNKVRPTAFAQQRRRVSRWLASAADINDDNDDDDGPMRYSAGTR